MGRKKPVKGKYSVNAKVDRAAFGQRVRARREAIGLSQREVAGSVGVALTAVNEWENGHRLPRDPDVLLRTAQLLGCSVDFLLTGTAGYAEGRADALQWLRAQMAVADRGGGGAFEPLPPSSAS